MVQCSNQVISETHHLQDKNNKLQLNYQRKSLRNLVDKLKVKVKKKLISNLCSGKITTNNSKYPTHGCPFNLMVE